MRRCFYKQPFIYLYKQLADWLTRVYSSRTEMETLLLSSTKTWWVKEHGRFLDQFTIAIPIKSVKCLTVSILRVLFHMTRKSRLIQQAYTIAFADIYYLDLPNETKQCLKVWGCCWLLCCARVVLKKCWGISSEAHCLHHRGSCEISS